MKPLTFSSVEPLESRIAPAGTTLFIGNPAASGDTEFNTAQPLGANPNLYFHSTHNGGVNYDSTDALGANYVAGTHTFYIKLTAGETIELWRGVGPGYQPLLTLKSGTAIAFFVDKNNDGDVESNELTGISLGAKTSLIVNGNVDGDIVTNFNDAIGKIDPTHLISSKQSITSLTVTDLNSDVAGAAGYGSIISGGLIASAVVGSATDILTGTAVAHAGGNTGNYAFNYSDTGAATGTIVTTSSTLTNPLPLMAVKAAGPGISKVIVAEVGLIQAGDGGTGGAGGSLSSITISSDVDGFTLQAGSGGAGNLTTIAGGAGGGISTVIVKGLADSTPNNSIQILGGTGGAAGGVAGAHHGNGGAGGAASKIYVGYDAIGSQSTSLLQDDVLVHAGTGGAGVVGGNGGSLSTVFVSSDAPDAVGHEITVSAGDGGANDTSISSGKAGAGGSVSSVNLEDLQITATGADILLTGGSAGATTALANGNSGGSITNATLVTYNANVAAGNGSNGNTSGGNGGSVTGVTLLATNGVINNNTEIDAGFGGNANNGKAGSGGNISTVQMLGVNLSTLTFNSGIHADGGQASIGTGGAGGSVTNVQVVDSSTSFSPAMNMSSGTGGDGTTAGGAGGSISKVTYSALNMNYNVTAGKGGDSAAGSGQAGAGGSILTSAFVSSGLSSSLDVTGTVIAGNGGVVSGISGTGGAGGSITTVNARADGDIVMTSGSGGSAPNSVSPSPLSTPGAGGSISGSNADSALNDTTVTAGGAGTTGSKPANGGSILKTNVLAALNISITAGNGGYGGAGGSISSVGYSTEQRTAPETVTVQAGQGSGGGLIGGAGGSISGLTGFVALTGTTAISAGDGVGVAASGGAGGNVSNVTILGGGGANTVLTIAAGDAGDAAFGKTGAHGGNVSGVAVDVLTQGTIFRSIAAGDGGAAGLGKGGIGGSVSNVHVVGDSNNLGDIGVRSGVAYGYTTMGGIFAGAAGTGVTNGAAGNVTNITADSIASIVAGRASSPQLVTLVDNIYLNGNTATVVKGDGSFQNFNVANLVGGVVSPTSVGANVFKYTDSNSDGHFDLGDVPTDGLIAAITLTNNRNFVPEAYLSATGFFDYLNPA